MIEAGSDRSANARDACGIAVMAKASLPGRTKTRLVPPLTYSEAAALNTGFIKDIADNVLAAALHTPIAGYMAYGPPGNAAFFRANVHAGFGMFEACFPNFGDCLCAAVCELLNRRHRGAIVLNSDSPTLPTALIVQAVELLRQEGDRAVLGPASDGGYYLLGLNGAHPRLFQDIAWSTSRVAEQTLERVRELGLEVHVLAPWYDVDDGEALSVLQAELTHGCSFDPAYAPYQATHTAELLRSILSAKAGVPALQLAAE
jgi:rSAM/selenodomain-associated transferase 1